MSEKNWVSKKGKQMKFARVAELGEASFEGIFLETYESEGKFGTQISHKFKATEGLELTPVKMRNGNMTAGGTIEAGDLVVLNGVGSLNNQLSDIVLGETVRVDYLGLKAIAKGEFAGSNAHMVEVFSDPDAAIIPKEDLIDYLYEGTEEEAS